MNDEGVSQIIGLIVFGAIGLLGVQLMHRDHARGGGGLAQKSKNDVRAVSGQDLLQMHDFSARSQVEVTLGASRIAGGADAGAKRLFDGIGRVRGEAEACEFVAHFEVIAVPNLELARLRIGIAAPAIRAHPLNRGANTALQG